MKTTILAAIAALGLGVGAAYASGAPVGYQPPGYGNDTANSGQSAGTPPSTKGG